LEASYLTIVIVWFISDVLGSYFIKPIIALWKYCQHGQLLITDGYHWLSSLHVCLVLGLIWAPFIISTYMLDVIARLDGHTARMPSLYHYGDGGGKKSRAELDSYPLRPQYQNKPKFMIQILIKFCHLRDSATGHLVASKRVWNLESGTTTPSQLNSCSCVRWAWFGWRNVKTLFADCWRKHVRMVGHLQRDNANGRWAIVCIRAVEKWACILFQRDDA
jgi:hypothetical protein